MYQKQIASYSRRGRLLKSEKKTQTTLDLDKAVQSFPSTEGEPKLGNEGAQVITPSENKLQASRKIPTEGTQSNFIALANTSSGFEKWGP